MTMLSEARFQPDFMMKHREVKLLAQGHIAGNQRAKGCLITWAWNVLSLKAFCLPVLGPPGLQVADNYETIHLISKYLLSTSSVLGLGD